MGKTAGEPWPSDRIYHRQMYIDLIRSYLRTYGSQRELAQAVGIHEVVLSGLLEPVRATYQPRRDTYWAETLTLPAKETAYLPDEVRVLSLARIQRIVEELSSDAERRAVLLEHLERAGESSTRSSLPPARLSGEEIQEQLVRLHLRHGDALRSPDPGLARSGYTDVWLIASEIAGRIDPKRHPAERAQVLLYLDDAAATFNRADLALSYARRALLTLHQSPPSGSGDRDRRHRLWINAVVAETRALNGLGLNQEALRLIERAKTFPGYEIEPAIWQRTLMEQQLSAIAGGRDIRIYDAEATADRVLCLTGPDRIVTAGIQCKLASIYLTQGSARSLRKTGKLVATFLDLARSESDLPPLRRAMLLRGAASYFHRVRDRETRDDLLRQCIQIIDAGGFTHQRAQLEREYGRTIFGLQADGT